MNSGQRENTRKPSQRATTVYDEGKGHKRTPQDWTIFTGGLNTRQKNINSNTAGLESSARVPCSNTKASMEGVKTSHCQFEGN